MADDNENRAIFAQIDGLASQNTVACTKRHRVANRSDQANGPQQRHVSHSTGRPIAHMRRHFRNRTTIINGRKVRRFEIGIQLAGLFHSAALWPSTTIIPSCRCLRFGGPLFGHIRPSLCCTCASNCRLMSNVPVKNGLRQPTLFEHFLTLWPARNRRLPCTSTAL